MTTRVQLHVFLASPSDVGHERAVVRATIEQHNRILEVFNAPELKVCGWERAPSRAGRPQQGINEIITSCDYAVFLFFEKWGSPTGRTGFASGTEEEFDEVSTARDNGTLRDFAVFFKASEHRAEPLMQFRTRLIEERICLFKDFGTDDELRAFVTDCVVLWVKDEGLNIARQGRRFTEPEPAKQPIDDRDSREPQRTETKGDERVTLAKAMYFRGEQGAAIAALQQVIASEPSEEALINLGVIYQALHRLQEAKETYGTLLALARENGDAEYETLALMNLGSICQELGQPDDYTSYMGMAAKSAGAEIPRNRILLRREQAGSAYQRGDYRASQKLWSEVVTEFREVGTDQDLLMALIQFAYASHKVMELSEMEAAAKEADTVARRMGWFARGGDVQEILATCCALRGKLEEAEEHFVRALNFRHKSGEVEGYASTIGNLGSFHMDLRRLPQARMELGISYFLYRQIMHKGGMLMQASKLADLELSLGNVSLAGYWIRRARQAYAPHVRVVDRRAFALANIRYVSATCATKEEFDDAVVIAERFAGNELFDLLVTVDIELARIVFEARLPHYARKPSTFDVIQESVGDKPPLKLRLDSTVSLIRRLGF